MVKILMDFVLVNTQYPENMGMGIIIKQYTHIRFTFTNNDKPKLE